MRRVPSLLGSHLLAAILAITVAAESAMAYEAMYPRTEAGAVELKTVPAVKALQAEGAGTYFKNDDSTFMKLFRYIDRNRVAMTVPVEADVESNRMRFFVGAADAARELPRQDAVSVVALPERRVVSAGLRGSYSPDTFARGLASVQAWLADHPEWRPAGEPYAVYWNGPFVPGFAKRSEVHQVVEAVSPTR